MKILKFTLILLAFGFNAFTSHASLRCEESYIPPASYNELIDIQTWAIVLVFINYADKAGFIFDEESYMQDNPNPNPVALDFGFVNGLSCYPVDVATGYASYFQVLTLKNYNNPENFSEFFYKESIKLGYEPYIRLKDENLKSIVSFKISSN